MGGWFEEVFYSLYSIGLCKEILGLDFEKEVLPWYIKAYNYRKLRLEPLYRIVNYYIHKKQFKEAFGYGMLGYKIKNTPDQLFITKDIYLWKFNDLLSRASSWLGLWEFSVDMIQTLITERKYPDNHHKRMLNNLKICRNQLIIERNNKFKNGTLQLQFI